MSQGGANPILTTVAEMPYHAGASCTADMVSEMLKLQNVLNYEMNKKLAFASGRVIQPQTSFPTLDNHQVLVQDNKTTNLMGLLGEFGQ